MILGAFETDFVLNIETLASAGGDGNHHRNGSCDINAGKLSGPISDVNGFLKGSKNGSRCRTTNIHDV